MSKRLEQAVVVAQPNYGDRHGRDWALPFDPTNNDRDEVIEALCTLVRDLRERVQELERLARRR